MSRDALVDAIIATALGIVLGIVLLFLTGCGEATPAVLVRHLDPVTQEASDGSPVVAQPYRKLLTAAAQNWWGLSPPVPVLAGQIHQESNWRPDVVSTSGAKGIAQFMDATARDFPDATGKVDAFSPEWAFNAQSQYMWQLHKLLVYARECDRMGAALASYNGGSGWHNKRRARAADPEDFWGSVRGINPGITESNQRQNFDYPEIIVYHRQVIYRSWGDGKGVCL